MDHVPFEMYTFVCLAKSSQSRMSVSEMIYQSDVHFQPVIHHIYHLYQRKADGRHVLSMVAPHEWGRKKPFEHLATVRLLGDHTWEVLAGDL